MSPACCGNDRQSVARIGAWPPASSRPTAHPSPGTADWEFAYLGLVENLSRDVGGGADQRAAPAGAQQCGREFHHVE